MGDIHTNRASVLFGVTVEEVSPQQRRLSKRFAFGLIYGSWRHFEDRLAKEVSKLESFDLSRVEKEYLEEWRKENG